LFFFFQNFYGTDHFGDHGAGFCKKRGINKEKSRLVRTEAKVWWRKLHNENLHDFHSGNAVNRMDKSIKREDVCTRCSKGKTSRKEPTWKTWEQEVITH
jgi:hypothetical protein